MGEGGERQEEGERRGDGYRQRKTVERKNGVVFISINNSGCVLSPVVCSCKLHASAIFFFFFFYSGKQPLHVHATNAPTHKREGGISNRLCHFAHRRVIYVKTGFSL